MFPPPYMHLRPVDRSARTLWRAWQVLSLHGVFRMRPAADTWKLSAASGLIALGVPELVLLANGQLSLAFYTCAGGLCALYGHGLPYAARARALGWVVFGMVAGVGVALTTAALTESAAVRVLVLALLAGVYKLICDASRIGPPGNVIFTFIISAAGFLPVRLAEVPANLELVLCGGVVAWVVCMAPALPRPHGPERFAVARALTATARLMRVPAGDPAAARARYDAAAASHIAWHTVRLVPGDTPQRVAEISGLIRLLVRAESLAAAAQSEPEHPPGQTSVSRSRTATTLSAMPSSHAPRPARVGSASGPDFPTTTASSGLPNRPAAHTGPPESASSPGLPAAVGPSGRLAPHTGPIGSVSESGYSAAVVFSGQSDCPAVHTGPAGSVSGPGFPAAAMSSGPPGLPAPKTGPAGSLSGSSFPAAAGPSGRLTSHTGPADSASGPGFPAAAVLSGTSGGTTADAGRIGSADRSTEAGRLAGWARELRGGRVVPTVDCQLAEREQIRGIAMQRDAEHPPGGIRRVLRAFRPDSPGFPLAVRVSVGAAAAGLLSVALGVNRPYWAVMTAAVLIVANTVLSWHRTVQRVLGNLAGVGLFSVLVPLTVHPVALVAVALICQLVVEATISRNYWVASIFVTPMALVMVEFAGAQPAGRLALDRWLDTCVGAAVAVAICFAVPNRRVFDRVALALRELDAVLGRARTALSSGRADHDVRRRLAAALVEVRESADIAAGEWWSTEVPEERIVASERAGHQVLAQLPVRLPVPV